MKRMTALVRIEIGDLDDETLQEIAESAEPHDTDGGLGRYLGDRLDAAEVLLNTSLPEGFSVRIDGAEWEGSDHD